MKLTCTQENLNKGVNLVARIASTKASLPVLSNILLATEGGRLSLSATDLEIGIKTLVGSKIDKEGAITLPSRLLLEFISQNTDPKIKIEAEGDEATLSSEHYQAKIKGINASEFPPLPQTKEAKSLKIETPDLREAINQTIFAVAHDETRPVLGGVLLKSQKKELLFVATDSYRLSEKKIKTEGAKTDEFEAVVPSRTLIEVARVVEADTPRSGASQTKGAELRFGENQLSIKAGETEIVSRVIEGSFPDYAQIIPQKFLVSVEIKKSELEEAMRLTASFAREVAGNVRLKTTKGGLEIFASSPQLGENRARLSAKTQGEGLEVAFNAKYILDVLGALTSPEILFQFSGKLSPAKISPKKGNGYLYIIMPLKLEE